LPLARLSLSLFFACLALLCAPTAHAQGNYEIQVYGAETVAPKNLMVELHSNFTPDGQKNYMYSKFPARRTTYECD
jgi:hypothetical protein